VLSFIHLQPPLALFALLAAQKLLGLFVVSLFSGSPMNVHVPQSALQSSAMPFLN
jgi:hypothetical protein